MVTDRIEQEIVIAATPERVWAVLTEAEHLGNWFGDGRPAKVDLRAGGLVEFDHGAHGPLLARIVEIEPPRLFTYRMSQSPVGAEPREGNATLVEFRLVAEGDGTRLRMVESGFAALDLAADWVASRHLANSTNWPGKLVGLARYAEKPAT
jgi:uncharacterized protein YndB with AHSA1/START domain